MRLLRFALLAVAALTGCANSAGRPFTPSESARLDRITTLDLLFPLVDERSLYAVTPPVEKDGQRHYGFSLKPQSVMTANRHFQIVTVSWARGGGAAPKEVPNTGGPNGAIVSHVATTPDGAYDVRVSVGELLPASARTGDVNLDRLTQRLIDGYRASRP